MLNLIAAVFPCLFACTVLAAPEPQQNNQGQRKADRCLAALHDKFGAHQATLAAMLGEGQDLAAHWASQCAQGKDAQDIVRDLLRARKQPDDGDVGGPTGKSAVPPRQRAPADDVEASKIGDAILDKEGMDPEASRRFKAILAELRADGIPIRVHEGFRNAGRQKDIYAAGRSDEKLRAVGYSEPEIRRARNAGFPPTGDTRAPDWRWGPKGHGGGLAMDVWWVVGGKGQPAARWASWRKRLDEATKAQGCAWGGSWQWKKDRPHVECFLKGASAPD